MIEEIVLEKLAEQMRSAIIVVSFPILSDNVEKQKLGVIIFIPKVIRCWIILTIIQHCFSLINIRKGSRRQNKQPRLLIV